jgi:deoxyribodipyrimidine photo-lyase
VPSAPAIDTSLPPAGERAAKAAARRFWQRRLAGYAQRRNLPGTNGTSRLSPYLKWGCLHPRQLLVNHDRSTSASAFRNELCWREFYADVLFHDPDSARRAWNPALRSMRMDTGRAADARFEAWASGHTGFPLVDAGMRQLLTEGWMHNRVRMLAASVLVKDLHLTWDRGARHFMRHLVDGDLASNSHGWQWVAGTGTDASPYVRVFNPITQSKRFDPNGDYIRHYVEELRDLPAPGIHQPWTLPGGPPNNYPSPIVDHALERLDAVGRYNDARRTNVS